MEMARKQQPDPRRSRSTDLRSVREENLRPVKDDPVLCATVYVRNVSIHVTLESLRTHFEEFGRIRDARLVKHSDTGTAELAQGCALLVWFR